MIAPRPLLRVIISVLFYQKNLYQIFHREMKIQCLIISTSTLLATVYSIDSTEYHFIINLKNRQINGITFVKNFAIPTKYGTIDEVELCLKILPTNCLCTPSLTLIFEYIERPPRRELNIK